MKLPEELKGWVFAALGVLLLIAGAVFFVAKMHRASSMARADGTVTKTYSGHPEIDFVTAAGQTVHFSESAATGYDVGDKVRVLYNPDDPERDPSIDTVRVYYFVPLGLLLMGAGFVAAGVFFALWHRRKARPPRVA